MTVPFVLDRAADTPAPPPDLRRWRTGILGGRFRRGERVPSTRAFAETYGVSRVTVTAAYDQLLAEGYFETRIGSGTFVSSGTAGRDAAADARGRGRPRSARAGSGCPRTHRASVAFASCRRRRMR